MKRTSKKSTSSDTTAYQRFYKYLPFLLYPLALFNLWFAIRYVGGHEERLDDMRRSAYNQISNVVTYVQAQLSNDIQQVVHTRSIAKRPVFTSLPPVSTNSLSLNLPLEVPSAAPVPRESFLEYSYFRVSGVPYVRVHELNYTVGEDFGLGTIESIYPLYVVCDGVRYRRTVQRPIINERTKINELP